MSYHVVVSPKFQKEFENLPKHLQERVRKLLKELETRLIGEPLKYDLKGFWSKHFEGNRYRLIYHKEETTIEVLAVHVGKRTNDFYTKFGEELKRRMKESKLQFR